MLLFRNGMADGQSNGFSAIDLFQLSARHAAVAVEADHLGARHHLPFTALTRLLFLSPDLVQACEIKRGIVIECCFFHDGSFLRRNSLNQCQVRKTIRGIK